MRPKININFGEPEKVNEEEIKNEVVIAETPPEEKPVLNRPALEISFEKGNFSPRSETAEIGQVVRWINNTDEQIILNDVMEKYTDMAGVVLNPGESFELTLKYGGYWTFEEMGSNKSGRLYVASPQF